MLIAATYENGQIFQHFARVVADNLGMIEVEKDRTV